jgi:lysophospholipase L1-like esterase
MWYTDAGDVQHILNVYYQNHPEFQVDKTHLVDLNLAYKAINYVKQVQNYLTKINCKFAIGYTLPGLADHEEILLKNLTDTANFFVAYNQLVVREKINVFKFLTQTLPPIQIFADLGNDGIHPGPKQHQIYANQFLELLQ